MGIHILWLITQNHSYLMYIGYQPYFHEICKTEHIPISSDARQMQTFCAGLHTIVNDKGKDATVQERTRLNGAFVALQCRKKSLNQSFVTRYEILKA